jgi:hypothetical protein
VQIGLAEEHRTSLREMGDRRRVAIGDVAVSDA